MIAKCETCNKEFKTYKKGKHKFCSVECYREGQRKGLYTKGSSIPLQSCTNCGNPVQRTFVKNRKGELCDKIFCSRNCYDEYRIKNTQKITYKCKECGKEIKGYKSDGAVFCSMDCRNKNITASERKCPVCGKSFKPTYVDKKGRSHHPNDRKFCSSKCLHKFYSIDEERKNKISEAFTGDKHPNWKGGGINFRGIDWRKNRREALQRDKVCQHCGMTAEESKEKFKSNLEVHHIVPFKQFDDTGKANELSNLIVLCKICHRKADGQLRKKKKRHENKINKKNSAA